MDYNCHHHLFTLELGTWNCERDDHRELSVVLWSGIVLLPLCGLPTPHDFS